LKEKNEGNAIASKQAQATQDWLTDREKKVCSAQAGQSQQEIKPVAQPAAATEKFYCCPECEKSQWYANESTQEERAHRKRRKRSRPCTPPELWDMWNISFPESDDD
jgi:hypothetical protein